ncbi:MAG TPA: polyphenol oxidase family protein [Acidimicrobiia bacterium]
MWTDRQGGVSAAPYDEANVAEHVGDDEAAVTENRRRLAARLGLPDPAGWCWLRQVHGRAVADAAPAAAVSPPEADAAVTTVPGLPLVVQTADCAPIALVSDDALGVVHAGWAGLLDGVVDAAVARLRSVGTGRVRAALGPCIHPDDYEFGRVDLDRLVATLGSSVESRTRQGTPALDLPEAVGSALARAGVDEIVDVDVCTFSSPDHFSHRRDGATGRQALVAVLDV